MRMTEKKTLILLNIAFLVYSLSSVISKFAASQRFLSFKWILLYGFMIFVLMIYAVVWQFVLKKIELITAYSNKAIVVIWGSIWGILLFHETLSPLKVIGIALIVSGIIVIARGESNA